MSGIRPLHHEARIPSPALGRRCRRKALVAGAPSRVTARPPRACLPDGPPSASSWTPETAFSGPMAACDVRLAGLGPRADGGGLRGGDRRVAPSPCAAAGGTGCPAKRAAIASGDEQVHEAKCLEEAPSPRVDATAVTTVIRQRVAVVSGSTARSGGLSSEAARWR